MKEYTNYSLLPYNTFGIDVKASTFIEYESVEDVQNLVTRLHTPYIILGRGSNMLFTQDFNGTVLHCGIQGIEQEGQHVIVGAGVVWDEFVGWTVAHGLSGVENLSLVPGEVGAAAVQNIGAYGVEVKDVVEWVEYVDLLDGSLIRKKGSELGYSYRQSIFKQDLKDKVAVTHVCFKLNTIFQPWLEYGGLKKCLAESLGEGFESHLTPADVRNTVIAIRRAKLPDPAVLGNAGSFFMNPIVSRDQFIAIQKDYPQMPYYEQGGGVKIPAGWLIEQCGWKGRALGRAGVYERQALVIVNLGGAMGKDIVSLSDAVRHDVKERFGIDISPEVRII